MAILCELWSGEAPGEQVLSTYQYVTELRERLEQTYKSAHENLKKVQIKKKVYYDNDPCFFLDVISALEGTLKEL